MNCNGMAELMSELVGLLSVAIRRGVQPDANPPLAIEFKIAMWAALARINDDLRKRHRFTMLPQLTSRRASHQFHSI
jgi:hypothetical protein